MSHHGPSLRCLTLIEEIARTRYTVAMNRTKVLFLITKSNWGGAQRYVYDLVSAIDIAVYEPVVVLGGNGELIEKLQAADIRTISLASAQRDMSIRKELRFFGELFKIVRREQPAVFHVNSSKAGGIGCFVGRVLGIKRVIFTAHGWAFNEIRPWWQKCIIKYFHWLTVLLSHKTIAVSHAIVEQMDWPLAARKMTVINPGRTVPEFQNRLQARTTIALAHPPIATYVADVWLCIVGELHPIKQHELLFAVVEKVIADHPHVRLVCVGAGELQSHLQTYIEEHGLTNHVFLIGHLDEAATILKAADLFVLPSLSESYGYVLHEAGLARVPIIASAVGGITDIVSDETEGTLIDPQDQAALTQAIRDFLRNPHNYTDQTQKLQTKLIARTVQSMTDATVAIYNR